MRIGDYVVRPDTGCWIVATVYSDPLEAYFSLVEGDAKCPINMLLETYPLNSPQREAIVGFLVIQVLRNAAIQEAVAPVIADLGYGDDPEMRRKAYEWGILRLLEGTDRSLNLGARLGASRNRWVWDRAEMDPINGIGVMGIFERYLLRAEYRGRYNGAFDGKDFYTFEVGVR